MADLDPRCIPDLGTSSSKSGLQSQAALGFYPGTAVCVL